MTIFLAADHNGFELKEKIVGQLLADEDDLQREVIDLGADHFEGSDDYPLYAEELGREVAKKKGSRGILFCRSGNGMVMTANKIVGVRAGLGFSVEAAREMVEHNQANVIAIPAGMLGVEAEVKAFEIAMSFLKAEAKMEESYERRVEEIKNIERGKKAIGAEERFEEVKTELAAGGKIVGEVAQAAAGVVEAVMEENPE